MNLGRSWSFLAGEKKNRQNYAGKKGDNNSSMCKHNVHFMKCGIYDSLCYVDGLRGVIQGENLWQLWTP